MRSRKIITVALLVMAGAGTAFLFPRSCAPLQVELVSSEPARISDDFGARMSLVTLRLRNCSSARLEFERNKIIEVRGADGWLPVPEAFYLEEMAPGASSELLLLLPPHALACRLPLKYQSEPLRWRIWSHVPVKARKAIAKWPTLRRWLLPSGNPMPRPPVWRETWLEAALPGASRSSATEMF